MEPPRTPPSIFRSWLLTVTLCILCVIISAVYDLFCGVKYHKAAALHAGGGSLPHPPLHKFQAAQAPQKDCLSN